MKIEGIDYELNKMNDLHYVLGKMSEYVNKVGFEKAVRSQKLIRHLHICIALKLQKELSISPENIHFELRLKNKNVDIGIVEDNIVKIAVSIRSQSSSIKKNFTNNVNSLQGEVVGLKTIYQGLKVGVVYLLKATDIDTKDNCMKYFGEMIPKKVLPLINTNIPTNDRYDAACIIIWDLNDKGKVELQKNLITDTYNIESFIEDIGEIIKESVIKSQFNISELNEAKFEEFLKSSS